MTSKDEIRFAKARYKIQGAVIGCFASAERLFPIELQAGWQHLDSMVGTIQGDSLDGQQLVQYRPKGAKIDETNDVALRRTGQV